MQHHTFFSISCALQCVNKLQEIQNRILALCYCLEMWNSKHFPRFSPVHCVGSQGPDKHTVPAGQHFLLHKSFANYKCLHLIHSYTCAHITFMKMLEAFGIYPHTRKNSFEVPQVWDINVFHVESGRNRDSLKYTVCCGWFLIQSILVLIQDPGGKGKAENYKEEESEDEYV